MFEMSLPWWELAARAALVYLALMLMVRLSGKRTVGQFTPFDLLVVMLLSEAVSNAMSGGDDSAAGGLVSAATLLGLNYAFAKATAHSRKLEEVVEGTPVLLARDGEVFQQVLKREHVGAGDMEKSLREADCNLEELAFAFLETDGSISILKKRR